MGLFVITNEEVKQLKTIITKEEAVERDRQRHRKHSDRATYRKTVREAAEQRRDQARLLRAKGKSLRQIADTLGVSLYTVKTYIFCMDKGPPYY